MSAQNPDSMRKVAENYPATDAGNWARLWLGDQDLRVGIEQLFQDRPQANDELRKAVFNYELVLQQNVDSLLAQRTKFGLARAYESLDRLDEARKIYEELANTAKWEPEPLFATQAEARLANLNLPQTKAFYDWFASQDPKPSLQGGGDGFPFSTPNLDSPLPDEPGSLGPSAFDSLRREGSLEESSPAPDATATEPAPDATESEEGNTPQDESPETEPTAEEPPADEPPADEPATPEAADEASSDETNRSALNEPAPSTP
jgi:hypothetical protein